MADLCEALIRDGFAELGQPVARQDCDALMTVLHETRRFGPELFLSEAEFEADPQYKGVNPRTGRNLFQALALHTGFILNAPDVQATLQGLLGAGYRLLDEKFVCGVPDSWLPEWVKSRIIGNPVNNLGAYVRPEYRDITYFYGIDYHQDIIDWKNRSSDFITLYVYIHPVTEADAPLHVLTGSHALGATLFPHDLTRSEAGGWRYGDRRGSVVEIREKKLVGETGYAALWHACTLHGTQPVTAMRERFSARFLLARAEGGEASLDRVNEVLRGPLSLEMTRTDLNEHGAAVVRQNIITQG